MDRFLDKHHSKFNQVMETIYKLVIINFLSIFFCLLGFVFLGFFPAIMTAYILIRRLIEKDDFPLLKTYKETFKNEFLKANQIGYIFAFIWLLLILSWFFYLNDLESIIHQIGLVIIAFMAIATFLMTCYLPICYAYFRRFKTFELVKFCLMIVFGMPVTTLMIGLSTLFFYAIVMIRFVTVFPFLAITLPAFVNIVLARKKLIKIFTVYTDDFVKIRTLNSHYDLSNLWHFIEEEIDQDLLLNYDQFQAYLNDEKIDYRLSLLCLDEKETPVGLLLVSKEEAKRNIDFILLAKGYQRRKYGKKMIEQFERLTKKEMIERIDVGHPYGLYVNIPKGFYKYLSFFKSLNYEFEKNSERYGIHKKLGGPS